MVNKKPYQKENTNFSHLVLRMGKKIQGGMQHPEIERTIVVKLSTEFNHAKASLNYNLGHIKYFQTEASTFVKHTL